MREVPPAEWDDTVDAYFRCEYVEASALLEEGGEPIFLEHEGVRLALILRGEDATSPAGYGGPLGESDDFGPVYDEWCRGRGIVSTFVRFHPLLRNERAWPFHKEPVAGSVSWRLQGDLLAGMHRHHRRLARKAEATGVEIAVREAPDDLAEFAGLYSETMARADAAAFYFFPDAYWEALVRVPLVLAEARLDGALVAASLCLAAPPWLHYHLGASERSGGANHLLFLEAARWARDNGYTRFHLGQGVGGAADSLLEFKLRFDPGGLLPSAVGKAIHDEDAYRDLGGEGFGGFFPAYRRAA